MRDNGDNKKDCSLAALEKCTYFKDTESISVPNAENTAEKFKVLKLDCMLKWGQVD